MNEKITVPANVANAIAHYVNLADSKTEAFTDILRLGYEAEKSEIILRHFDHDYDELMQALVCGYEVEKSPEEELREYYVDVMFRWSDTDEVSWDRYYEGSHDAIITVLGIYGIKVAGVNA
jgi:DNA integrity scanning protein DisA with diadenylate cyclase activity